MTWLAKFLNLFTLPTQPKPRLLKQPASPGNSKNIIESMKPSVRLSSKYFTDAELRCRGGECGCGNAVILDPIFDKALLRLRETLNLPMKVNSCCRCVVHNKRVGGEVNSFHISDAPAWMTLSGTGAIDIGYTDTSYRNTLAMIAHTQGWRIGLHRSFLHLDIAHMAGYTHLPRFFKYQKVVTNKEFIEFIEHVRGE